VCLLALVLACPGPQARAARDSVPAPPPRALADSAPRILTPSGPADTAVSWDALAARLRRRPGEIRAVTESRNGKVTVHFKDGSALRSVEPEAGALQRLVRAIDPSGEILVATD
jgi:hypothetical protein